MQYGAAGRGCHAARGSLPGHQWETSDVRAGGVTKPSCALQPFVAGSSTASLLVLSSAKVCRQAADRGNLEARPHSVKRIEVVDTSSPSVEDLTHYVLSTNKLMHASGKNQETQRKARESAL